MTSIHARKNQKKKRLVSELEKGAGAGGRPKQGFGVCPEDGTKTQGTKKFFLGGGVCFV
jgi:hypothetical protein